MNAQKKIYRRVSQKVSSPTQDVDAVLADAAFPDGKSKGRDDVKRRKKNANLPRNDEPKMMSSRPARLRAFFGVLVTVRAVLEGEFFSPFLLDAMHVLVADAGEKFHLAWRRQTQFVA